jgi:hypothetical protein
MSAQAEACARSFRPGGRDAPLVIEYAHRLYPDEHGALLDGLERCQWLEITECHGVCGPMDALRWRAKFREPGGTEWVEMTIGVERMVVVFTIGAPTGVDYFLQHIGRHVEIASVCFGSDQLGGGDHDS